jgi:Carboxypeptidase regulatory-like domain
MRQYKLVAMAVFALAALAGARAQTNVGHLRGVVKDISGGVVPGVDVRVSRAGGPERATLTDAHGEFAFLALEPGRYSIRATRSQLFRSNSELARAHGG